ncbi:hypothetical protein DID88_008908 [Monilinia fructigena]|uniref:Uncharacterized protein n=1 Tax=Monilinia fructigena TaxID=38457 RepID=A0A395J7V4_9HELO|nr:hypothetical protein DID88_008908 [Monilinia fructigena]
MFFLKIDYDDRDVIGTPSSESYDSIETLLTKSSLSDESVFHPHYDGRILEWKHGLCMALYWAGGGIVRFYHGIPTPMSKFPKIQCHFFLASYYNMTVFHYKTPRIPEGRDYMLESIMRKSLTLTDFEGHHFDDDKMEWIPVKQEIQKPMEPQKGSSTTTKKRSSTEGRGDQAGRRKKLQKRLKKKAKQKAAQEAQQNDTPPDEQKAADKRKKNEDKMKEEAEKVENSVSTFIIVQLSQGSIRPSNTCQQSIFQQLLH